MHVLIWLACAAGCGILWIVQELVGSVIGEAIGAGLKWMFSPLFAPLGRGLTRRLDGPNAAGWRWALILLGLSGLAGGIPMFLFGMQNGSAAQYVLGLLSAAGSLIGLLWLDGRDSAPPVDPERKNGHRHFGRAE